MRIPHLGIILAALCLFYVGCTVLVDPYGEVKMDPSFFYEAQSEHYPNTRWSYLGSDKLWHYFSHYNFGPMNLNGYKIRRKHLPTLETYPYDAENPKSTSTDVEIHADFIRIHIDGQNPMRIPFESRGFISAGHRPKDRSVRVTVVIVATVRTRRSAAGREACHQSFLDDCTSGSIDQQQGTIVALEKFNDQASGRTSG